MATITPNNSWPVPTSTDYVKDGAVAIETLGDAIDTSVGTGLLAWSSYTPTFTGLTLGNGTITFYYAQLGKTVFVSGRITFGTTTLVTGVSGLSLTLPVTARTSLNDPNIGNVIFRDLSVADYFGMVTMPFTTTVKLQAINTAGTYATSTFVSATVPFTWAANDSINFSLTYQAA